MPAMTMAMTMTTMPFMLTTGMRTATAMRMH
jgi:hypothetical protein